MGVGKTHACRLLRDMTDRCVFLDGDWCWDMHIFTVNDDTIRMVEDNINALLTNFLRCPSLDNIIFCWVMHEQSIIDGIKARLPLQEVNVAAVSLICSPEALTKRLSRDVEARIRKPDIIERSVNRLPLYDKLDTIKIDTTALSPEQTADALHTLL